MPEPSVPRVVVVADPDDARDIAELLASVGQPVAWSGPGDDDTLARLAADPVDVVVLSARLAKGDARSFAGAARGEDDWEVSVVLVGEDSGPVRNALDAADYEVDRFVGRPLSAKALRFAIKNCRPDTPREIPASRSQPVAVVTGVEAGAETGGETGGETTFGGVGEEPPPPTELSARVEGGRAVETTFGGVGEEPPPPRKVSQRIATATDLAIDAFLQDAMASLPESVTDSGWAEEAAAAAADDAGAEPSAPAPEDPGAGPGEVPAAEAAPSWREPTMILSGGPSPAPQSVHDAPTRRVSQYVKRDPGDAGGAGDDRRDDKPAADGDARGGDAGAEAAAASERVAASPSAPDEVGGRDQGAAGDSDEAPGGPMYGEQLRAKMSAMAERLFPDRNDAAATVTAPLATDADIDLATLGAAGAEDASTDDSTFVPGLDDDAPVADDAGGAAGHLQGEIDVTTSRRVQADTGASAPDKSAERDADTISGSRRGAGERRGTLSDTDTASLLAQLYRNRHNGTLVMTRDEVVKTVYLEDGRPVFATSNAPHDRMGDLLYREGKITREQHARSREVVAESRHRMGELLVDMGFIKPRELMPAVRRHLEDSIYSLFSWSSGTFSVGEGEDAPDESIRLSRHPAAVIAEGVRRKYGLDLLEGKLGGPASVLSVPDPDALAALMRDVDLGAGERAICEAFDGERSLREVARASGAEMLTVYQIGFALTVLGVARLSLSSEQIDDWNEPVRPPMLVGETELAIDRQRVLAKYEHVNEADYFRLLGVRRDASSFEIKRAYEAARRDYAIESFPAKVRRELSRELDEINELLEEAYRVLRNDAIRTRYRQALRD